jgi:hypothetical protein
LLELLAVTLDSTEILVDPNDELRPTRELYGIPDEKQVRRFLDVTDTILNGFR